MFNWPLKKKWNKSVQGFGEPWCVNTKKLHTGVDLPAPAGENVFAVSDGVISKKGTLGTEWADYLVLEHEEKDYCSCYLHIIPCVDAGAVIKRGEVIGNIAKISACHLHFNIWKGSSGTLAPRGALPKQEFVGKVNPITDPAFPHNFIDPLSFDYHYGEDVYDSKETVSDRHVIKIDITRELKKGVVGPDVIVLQKCLNSDPDTIVSASGIGSCGNETESFGPLTEEAVKKFQIKFKIATPDEVGYGIVGPKTILKLKELFQNI